MKVEAKISNPLCIRLGNNTNIIMADDNYKKNLSLNPGALIGGEHYGFILIADTRTKQVEKIYPTQCRICAIDKMDGMLRVFEENKKLPWLFDKYGNLEHSIHDEFPSTYWDKMSTISKNSDRFLEEPTIFNPLHIHISTNPLENKIIKDELVQEDYPLYPGAMLGTTHYGFVLTIDFEDRQKEVSFPTQNPVVAAAQEGNEYTDIKIYEEGKYNPWLFTFRGEFKQQSSYNEYSKRDHQYIKDNYNVDDKTIQLKLNKKKS